MTMKPDALLRMTVYQEGQRAYRSGDECPYTDWRAGTWAKGREAAGVYLAPLMNAKGRETLTFPCVVGNQIRELTGEQREALEWRQMPADEKIAHLLERVEALERAVLINLDHSKYHPEIVEVKA